MSNPLGKTGYSLLTVTKFECTDATVFQLEIETFHEKNQTNEIIFLGVISIYLDQSNYIFGRSKILF